MKQHLSIALPLLMLPILYKSSEGQQQNRDVSSSPDGNDAEVSRRTNIPLAFQTLLPNSNSNNNYVPNQQQQVLNYNPTLPYGQLGGGSGLMPLTNGFSSNNMLFPPPSYVARPFPPSGRGTSRLEAGWLKLALFVALQKSLSQPSPLPLLPAPAFYSGLSGFNPNLHGAENNPFSVGGNESPLPMSFLQAQIGRENSSPSTNDAVGGNNQRIPKPTKATTGKSARQPGRLLTSTQQTAEDVTTELPSTTTDARENTPESTATAATLLTTLGETNNNVSSVAAISDQTPESSTSATSQSSTTLGDAASQLPVPTVISPGQKQDTSTFSTSMPQSVTILDSTTELPQTTTESRSQLQCNSGDACYALFREPKLRLVDAIDYCQRSNMSRSPPPAVSGRCTFVQRFL